MTQESKFDKFGFDVNFYYKVTREKGTAWGGLLGWAHPWLHGSTRAR